MNRKEMKLFIRKQIQININNIFKLYNVKTIVKLWKSFLQRKKSSGKLLTTL